ncbi:MAG: DUF6328 family protein [Nocardioidaceae bacterium]
MAENSSQRDDSPESESGRLNRNWIELLQELRVTQTGIQILTGFLLTLPFQQRFATLDGTQRVVYLAVLSLSVLTTCLLVAPVSFHRIVFRKHERVWLISAADHAARAGLITLAATFVGVVWLVFDVVEGRVASTVAGAVALVIFAGLWWVIPLASSAPDVMPNLGTGSKDPPPNQP